MRQHVARLPAGSWSDAAAGFQGQQELVSCERVGCWYQCIPSMGIDLGQAGLYGDYQGDGASLRGAVPGWMGEGAPRFHHLLSFSVKTICPPTTTSMLWALGGGV